MIKEKKDTQLDHHLQLLARLYKLSSLLLEKCQKEDFDLTEYLAQNRSRLLDLVLQSEYKIKQSNQDKNNPHFYFWQNQRNEYIAQIQKIDREVNQLLEKCHTHWYSKVLKFNQNKDKLRAYYQNIPNTLD